MYCVMVYFYFFLTSVDSDIRRRPPVARNFMYGPSQNSDHYYPGENSKRHQCCVRL